MGGIKDALFGSEGEPSRIVDTIPSAFERLQNPVSNTVQNLINTGGPAGPSGPLVAPQTDAERALTGELITRASTPGAGATAARDYFTSQIANPQGGRTAEETAALSRVMGAGIDPAVAAAGNDLARRILSGEFLSPESNPYLRASIESAQRPLIDQFREVALPRLQGEFARAGQFSQPNGSSPFDRAAALATTGLTGQLGDIATRLTAANYDAERARQLEAFRTVDQAASNEAGRARGAFDAASSAGAEGRARAERAASTLPALDEQEVNGLLQALQAAALPRLIQDQGIERGLQIYRERVAALLDALRLGGSLASPRPAVLPGTEGSPGLLGGVARGFGSAAGTAAAGAIF